MRKAKKTKKSFKKGSKKRFSLAVKLTIAFLIIIFLVVFALFVYKQGFKDGKAYAYKHHKNVHIAQKKVLKKSKSTPKRENNLVQKLQSVLSKEQRTIEIDPNHEFDSTKLGYPPKGPKRKKIAKKSVYTVFKKPKLAIIIDDVSFAHDVKSIKALNMHLTMSFLPPSPIHPNSARLAAREKLYMVHLPLEAMRFSAEEPNTLHVNDSKRKIYRRIKEIERLFPRTYYINNHTGSRFTSNEKATRYLIEVLNKEGIGFLDSRTTSDTKVPKVMRSLGKQYVARDIFLDHKANVLYIQGQIKKAIKKAKEYGSAIAIGHPRKETLQALKNSKDILKTVDLVYINKVI